MCCLCVDHFGCRPILIDDAGCTVPVLQHATRAGRQGPQLKRMDIRIVVVSGMYGIFLMYHVIPPIDADRAQQLGKVMLGKVMDFQVEREKGVCKIHFNFKKIQLPGPGVEEKLVFWPVVPVPISDNEQKKRTQARGCGLWSPASSRPGMPGLPGDQVVRPLADRQWPQFLALQQVADHLHGFWGPQMSAGALQGKDLLFFHEP
ncbi:hypothetical protein BJ166DRAFT_491006 [Pestalotiopsis sp. NC0098]|nr:hypothetical protein BJ166DRAFT_491006 [Pestalotiopsis sp. NC0098]